jgi:hypothetical protein
MIAGAIVIGCSAATTEEPKSEPLPQASADQGNDDGSDPAFVAQFDGGSPRSTKNDAGGSTSNVNCIDPNDSGSSVSGAQKLPDTNDCDNSFRSINGVANGPADIDFYTLSAKDEGVSLDHPIGCKRQTDFNVQNENIELCVFATCQNTTTNAVTGCSAGDEAQSDFGAKGCCTNKPGSAVPTWSCSGITKDDSADFFIRVRQVNTNMCLPYKVSYRY